MTLINKLIQGSQWAKQHPWTARTLLVISHLLLTMIAIRTGFFLQEQSISVPVAILWGTVALFILSIYYYPQKTSKGRYASKLAFYVRQKSCDGLLVLTTFMMITQQANHFASTNETPFDTFFGYQTNASLPDRYYEEKKAAKLNVAQPIEKDIKAKGFSWKEKKENWKNNVRKFFHIERELGNGEKAAYTILGIIGAVALLFLVLMAACNLSCSGAEGLATIVGVGGTILIIVLFVMLMKNIYKKKKPMVAKET